MNVDVVDAGKDGSSSKNMRGGLGSAATTTVRNGMMIGFVHHACSNFRSFT